jgi:hypothetical protein
MKTTDFKTFTDYTRQVSVPAGHKHGTVFKVSKKTLNALINNAQEKTSANKFAVK